jgi:hypothetical protein
MEDLGPVTLSAFKPRGPLLPLWNEKWAYPLSFSYSFSYCSIRQSSRKHDNSSTYISMQQSQTGNSTNITIMHGQHAGNLKCHDSSNATNRFISKKPCTGPLNTTGMQLLYCTGILQLLYRHNQLVYYIGKQVLVTEYFTFPTSIQQQS